MEETARLLQGGLSHVGPVFAKSLSAIDTREARTNQSGIYFPNTVARELFGLKCERGFNEEKPIAIHWIQSGDITSSKAKYYGAKKNESRITGEIYTPGLIERGDTGSLFVFWRVEDSDYAALVIKEEDNINLFLEEYGLTPSDLGRIVVGKARHEQTVDEAIHKYLDIIEESGVPFPGSREVSAAARLCRGLKHSSIISSPDSALLSWTNAEYGVFRGLEELYYGRQIRKTFVSVDDFVSLALSITNRRKSRAGHSFENQLEALFEEFGLSFETQVTTESKKRPDFLFPGAAAYFESEFPTQGLTVLAAKTTCKDRWRQVITEADRLRDGWKYLCTLQQGVSEMQVAEMLEDQVRLVCPEPYHRFFAKSVRGELWTIRDFIKYTSALEDDYSRCYGVYYRN